MQHFPECMMWWDYSAPIHFTMSTAGKDIKVDNVVVDEVCLFYKDFPGVHIICTPLLDQY